MIEEEGQTQAAAPTRRLKAAGRPLGTLLLAKALDLTHDEAATLRDDVAALRERGWRTLAREVVAGAKDGFRSWLEKSRG